MRLLSHSITSLAGWLLMPLPLFYLFGVAIADIAGMAILLLFLLHSTITRDWSWTRLLWVRLALLLSAYLALRGIFTEHPLESARRGAEWLRFPLLAAAIGIWLLPDPSLRRGFAISWIAATLLILLDCLLQWASGHDILGHPGVPLEGMHAMMRLTGPFNDPKVGIILLWLLFPAVAACGMLTRNRWSAGGLWLAGCLIILMSGERMALLLAGLGTLIFALLVPAVRRPVIGLAIAFVAMLAILASLHSEMIDRQVHSTVEAVRHIDATAYGKIGRSALAMIEDHPLVGVGSRQFRERCTDLRYGSADPARCNLHPHQFYLEWLSETGLIGLALFLAMIAAWARDLWRGRGPGSQSPEWPGLLVAIALRLWPIATATSFFVAWSALPFWLAFGWAFALIPNPRTRV